MQQLLDAVKQVKQTIQTHKSDLINNEALTRYALVDVILNALGWDVHDPSKVFPEYNKGVGGGRADYALLDNNGKVVALLEAKKLNNLSTNDLIQVTNYAFHSGIRYSLTTDGNVWVVVDAFKQVPFSEKEIMRFNLETEPENLLLIKLVSLMPVNFYANEPFFLTVQEKTAVPSIAVQSSNSSPVKIVSSPRQIPTTPKSDFNNVSQSTSTGWKPLSQITNLTIAPKEMKFPDTTIVAVNSKAINVLKQVAEWLIKIGKLPPQPIIDFHKGKRNLISAFGKHPNDKDFGVEHRAILSNSLYLHTTYSTPHCFENALWLLHLAGENPNDYYFR